ncbi:MAG: copper amine oxidase [Filimonas sp.]|nr:copper amine oxidase [Filimonas sp.]
MKRILLAAGLLSACMQLKAQTITVEMNKAIVESKQGSIVNLPGILSEKFPSLDYSKIVLPGPQYFISDDPEYIRVEEAVAFRGYAEPGSVRFYVYNVNGVKEPAKIDRKIMVVIKNTGKAPLHLRMLKYSSQKPSGNYFQIGKQGLADYFNAKPSDEIKTIAPGAAMTLDPKHEKNIVKYDELVHGIYEFVIDQPAELSVIQSDLKTSGPEALKRITNVLPPKSKSGAGRGLFGISNYQVATDSVYDTKQGIAQIVVADGKKDPWVLGKEQVSGQTSTLAGNYGILYNMDIKWKSTDGKGLALMTWNARSDGGWCNGMAATMVTSKGKFDAGVIQLPADQLITKRAPEAILVQVFTPSANGEEQTIHLTYSPPGASCLPTPLLLIPVDLKK